MVVRPADGTERAGPRGPPGENDPGGRNDRLGSRAGARRGGGAGVRREGVASMRASRAPSARGRRLGGRAGTSRAPRAPRGSCARVGLSPRTRARTGRRAAGPRRRSTPPGARDHPRRTPSRGDPRTGGDARSARPGREASGSQTLPRVCRISNRRAKIARQRHDILARVMMRMRFAAVKIKCVRFGGSDRRARRGSAECLSMVSQGVSARTRAPVPEPTRPRPASATPPRPPLHLSVLSPRPQPDGVSRLLVGALAVASAARDPSQKSETRPDANRAPTGSQNHPFECRATSPRSPLRSSRGGSG